MQHTIACHVNCFTVLMTTVLVTNGIQFYILFCSVVLYSVLRIGFSPTNRSLSPTNKFFYPTRVCVTKFLILKLCRVGGSTLYIESSLTRPLEQLTDAKDSTSGGHLHVTGHLGDVMKESAQIAHTVAKTYLTQLDAHNDFLQKAHIHVHVPEVCANVQSTARLTVHSVGINFDLRTYIHVCSNHTGTHIVENSTCCRCQLIGHFHFVKQKAKI